MRRIRALAPVLLVMTLAGSGPVGAADPGDLAAANNRFGVELFRILHGPNANTFISPTSVATCLQAAAQASRGETRAEFIEALHLGELQITDAVEGYLDSLRSRADVTLRIANSLWADPGKVALNDGYVAEMKQHFDTEVRAEPFADPETSGKINGWINDATEGMIPEMLDRIPENAVAYLINAIYFKGSWTEPFDPEETTEQEFRFAAGGSREVPLMWRTDRIRYLEDGGVQVAKLPYGADEKTAMWIALPDSLGGLDALVDSLSAGTIDRWHRQASRRRGTIALPRFGVRYKATLNDPLRSLGIERAFDRGQADFSRLGDSIDPGNVFISRVLHEAVVEVNEEGTEAAAATAVEFGVTSVPVTQPFTMICDHPFLFAITDETTGSILFLGAVHQPEPISSDP